LQHPKEKKIELNSPATIRRLEKGNRKISGKSLNQASEYFL
jgi:hypothetical protein